MHLLITLLKNMKNNNNNLPKGWRKVKLGEIVNVSGGGTPSTSNPKYWGGNIAWLTPAEVVALNGNRFIDKTERYITEEGLKNSSAKVMPVNSLLLTSRATIGEVVINKIPMATNQGFINIEPKNVNLMFLFYWLKNNRKFLNQMAIGSTFNELSKSVFKKIDILIPEDINEQKRIADILSAFDDKIEVNNKIIKTLEEMAQEIFKEWFNENSKFKSQRSKLWDNVRISDLVWIISGYPFSSKLYNKYKRGFGVVTIKNVQDGSFITECDSFIEEEKIPKNMNQECLISDGDILLSLTGNVGRVCFVYGGKYLLNQRVAKLKPKNPNDLAFIYFLFRQPNMQNLLINMAKGSAQPNLSPVETGEIEITIPTREILDKLNKVINPMYEKLIKLKVENQKLAELRDLLLPKLMSGEIRV
jgi:type I restriction enzyme S subunit